MAQSIEKLNFNMTFGAWLQSRERKWSPSPSLVSKPSSSKKKVKGKAPAHKPETRKQQQPVVQPIKVHPRLTKFLHHSNLSLNLLEKFRVSEIGAILDIYRRMPFASSQARGLPSIAAKFFSTLKVANDDLSLKARVKQQKWWC